GFFGGSIAAVFGGTLAVTYGSMAVAAEVEMLSLYGSGAFTTALASPLGQVMLKSSIDMTAQGLINNGEINPVASFTGALVPGGATVKSAISSGIVSEATDLGMKELS